MSSVYPGCIIGNGNAKKTMVVVIHTERGELVLFEKDSLFKTSARCRPYDALQNRALKHLKSTLASKMLTKVSRLIDALREAFDPNELSDPQLAELLGYETVYYTINNTYLKESLVVFPENIKRIAVRNYRMAVIEGRRMSLSLLGE